MTKATKLSLVKNLRGDETQEETQDIELQHIINFRNSYESDAEYGGVVIRRRCLIEKSCDLHCGIFVVTFYYER